MQACSLQACSTLQEGLQPCSLQSCSLAVLQLQLDMTCMCCVLKYFIVTLGSGITSIAKYRRYLLPSGRVVL